MPSRALDLASKSKAWRLQLRISSGKVDLQVPVPVDLQEALRRLAPASLQEAYKLKLLTGDTGTWRFELFLKFLKSLIVLTGLALRLLSARLR
eukprot:s6187_g7.t1